MQMQSESRTNILRRIADVSPRSSAIASLSISNEGIYKEIDMDLLSCFCKELGAVNGQVIVCENKSEVYARILDLTSKHEITEVGCIEPEILKELSKLGLELSNADGDFGNMQLGITGCEYLVARTGSVIVTSRLASGRKMNVFPPTHVIVASQSQLVGFLDEAINRISEKYKNNIPSTISVVTGPSRTADIEKSLVLGAHGPKELFVLISKE